ncbi:MAG: hypothetical protein V4619_01995 [Bacteroidota bacterium]
MEQTDIKLIITESLNILKEKIVVALQNDDAEAVDKEIATMTATLTTMLSGLEELAFEAGRMQETDGSFSFDDFEDFQTS